MTKGLLAITGGTGFVGKAVIRQALADGWNVRALARSTQSAISGVEWVHGALDQPNSLDALLTGTDAVIHVAGVVNSPDRSGFVTGNINGTAALLAAAARTSVRRFVHVSSLAAREPGLSTYGWSKAEAENAVSSSGLDWTMVRPPWVFGPGDTDTLDLFKIARSGFLFMPPLGRTSVIEVGDLARLLLALVPARETIGQIFEPDDGEPQGWTNAGFGQAIGWALDKRVHILHLPRWLMAAMAKGDQRLRRSKARLTMDRVNYMCHPDWTVDPAKQPPATVWLPQVRTRSGLKATARSYRAMGWI